jgi:hypothetical protein
VEESLSLIPEKSVKIKTLEKKQGEYMKAIEETDKSI